MSDSNRATSSQNSCATITLHPPYGAGDGNRTRVSTLEGWRSTIELHRRRSQPEFHWSHYCGRRFTGCRYIQKGGSHELHDGHGQFSHAKHVQSQPCFLRCAFTHINTTGFLFAYQSILSLTKQAGQACSIYCEIRKIGYFRHETGIVPSPIVIVLL